MQDYSNFICYLFVQDTSSANQNDSPVLHPVMTTNTAEMLGIKPELYKLVVSVKNYTYFNIFI